MKIDGTDPLTINRLRNQTGKSMVHKLGESPGDSQVKRRQEAIRGKEPPRDSNQSYAEKLENAVRQANETAEALNVSIRFKLHESSERYFVQIVNRVDNEVIKEIPPEKVLNLLGQILEMIGLLLDEKR